MNKGTTSEETVTPSHIINLISTDPALAFDKLVSSGLYRKDRFWAEYATVNLQHIKDAQTDPGQMYFLHRINGLKFFFDLKGFYRTSIDEQTRKLHAFNSNPRDVLKVLFTALDMSEMNVPKFDVKYSREALGAVRTIYQTLPKPETPASYSLDLFNIVSQLFGLQVDSNMVDSFLDLYLMDDLLILPCKERKGYELTFIADEFKEKSFYIREALKSSIQRGFRQETAQQGISDEKHFRVNDPKSKTHEGLAVISYNSNVIDISEVGKGLTAVPMDDEIFRLMSSSDAAEQTDGNLRAMTEMMEHNFHHKLRHAIADIYVLNDEIDIHALHIELGEGKFLTLFELLVAVCSLTAMSDNIRYLSDVQGFPALYRSVRAAIRSTHPEYCDDELDMACAANIASHLPMLESRDEFTLFLMLSNEMVLSILRKVEELKSKSDTELQGIIDLLASSDHRLPYNILYKSDNEYLLNFQVCTRFPVARDFYDYYITERLFTPKPNKHKAELIRIDKNQKSREMSFNQSLRRLLSQLTPYVMDSLDFKSPNPDYNFGELEGDIDAIAYFENENLIMPMQVKLSNRTPWNEKRKRQWVEDKLINGKSNAVSQVNKDRQLLQNTVGLKFIASQLGLGKEIDCNTLTIYPLIVTDNFFADHERLPYGDEGNHVLCVSYFEIKNLIQHQKVHVGQSDWEAFTDKMPAHHLIDLLERNVFWEFLDQFVKTYSVRKSLLAINEEHRVHLNI